MKVQKYFKICFQILRKLYLFILKIVNFFVFLYKETFMSATIEIKWHNFANL